MQYTNLISCILIGYLMGTSNLAYFLSLVKNVDLRSGGSGNLGTSNAVVMMGKKAGILVLIHDVLKSTIAVILCCYLFPSLTHAGIIAGVASVFGHIFPFYLRFKGGKGFASYLGLLLGIDWRFALVMVFIVIIISFLADWIVAGTFSTILLSPVYLCYSNRSYMAMILLSASVCIFLKHLENIEKKSRGEEISVKKALHLTK